MGDYGCKCNCDTFREHIGNGPALSMSITPTRSGAAKVREVNEREATWDKDHAAYRRMRREGLQPKHLAGSADLEREARDPVEITDGRIYGKKLGLVKEFKTALKEEGTKKEAQ